MSLNRFDLDVILNQKKEMAFSCKHSNNCNEILTIQQGETFELVFEYCEDEENVRLPEGYDLFVGIYNIKGDLVISGSLLNGSIIESAIGTHDSGLRYTYSMNVSHEDSMLIVGKVSIEITIKNTDNVIVEHANEIVYIASEPRYNNNNI